MRVIHTYFVYTILRGSMILLNPHATFHVMALILNSKSYSKSYSESKWKNQSIKQIQ